MTDVIYVQPEKGKLIEMVEGSNVGEGRLQRLLEDHPDLLAGTQINQEQPRRWLLVGRELRIPSEEEGPGYWILDHLFLDQDGIPTIAEVKASTDYRIRREVIG